MSGTMDVYREGAQSEGVVLSYSVQGTTTNNKETIVPICCSV